MTQPMIGHRSADFVALYQKVQPRLQMVFGTKDPVFLSTSSAWGIMEGALNNVCQKKVLNCMCGAFSDKWNDVALRNGLEADPLRVEWGEHIDPAKLREALETGEYDAVTLVHNETSCGMMNPLADIMEVLRDFPEVISIIDTVSSFSAVPIPKDDWGIDIMITGSQKALAMPPGLALCSVSDRALERAAHNNSRGYYFDLHEFKKNHDKGMTPSTPNIPLIYALDSKLEDIESEGLDNRYQRHAQLNDMVHTWVTDNGFELFPQKEFASKSLTCARNTREIDLPALNKYLREHYGVVIDGGYGKVKGKTFRISNMGDETEETIRDLLNALNDALAKIA